MRSLLSLALAACLAGCLAGTVGCASSPSPKKESPREEPAAQPSGVRCAGCGAAVEDPALKACPSCEAPLQR
ncbi:MAG: hypothetical protein AB7N76_14960 [Planctomycetota bacterium]